MFAENQPSVWCVCVCVVCVYVCVCVCLCGGGECVCVWERKREREEMRWRSWKKTVGCMTTKKRKIQLERTPYTKLSKNLTRSSLCWKVPKFVITEKQGPLSTIPRVRWVFWHLKTARQPVIMKEKCFIWKICSQFYL